MREILLATDFSDIAERARRVAADYARAWGARLHLLHVVPKAEDAFSMLSDQARELDAPSVVATTVAAADPAREIVAYARRHAVDLVVLGTHGRSGVSRLLLGSVAERVARTAPCPVLTVGASVPVGSVVEAGEEEETHRCVVCAKASLDLICEPCRAHIRGEAIARKQQEERAGRV